MPCARMTYNTFTDFSPTILIVFCFYGLILKRLCHFWNKNTIFICYFRNIIVTLWHNLNKGHGSKRLK